MALLAAGSLTAQITITVDNELATVRSTIGAAPFASLTLPVGPIQSGKVVATGVPIAAGSLNARLKLQWGNTTAATIRHEVLAETSAGSSFDWACYCPVWHYSFADARILLSMRAAQPTLAAVQITLLTVPAQPILLSTSASVDLDLDGNSEFSANATTAPSTFLVPVGPEARPMRISVQSIADSSAQLRTGTLRVDITPVMEVLSGYGQVTPATEAFAQPIAVRVLDAAGQPVGAGRAVSFTAVGPATLSAATASTDNRSIATVTATATSGAGAAEVRCLGSGNSVPLVVPLFVRKLQVSRTATSLDLVVTNAPVANGAPVPMALAIAPAGITPLQTFLGPICTNPFDPGTLVFEDSLGPFGFVSLSGQGASGTPNLFRSYPIAPGTLAGVAVWVQGVGFDPDRGLFRTNCEQRTL